MLDTRRVIDFDMDVDIRTMHLFRDEHHYDNAGAVIEEHIVE